MQSKIKLTFQKHFEKKRGDLGPSPKSSYEHQMDPNRKKMANQQSNPIQVNASKKKIIVFKILWITLWKEPVFVLCIVMKKINLFFIRMVINGV